MDWRVRLTRMFLWIAVLSGGVVLGAKIFDNRVLVGAWSASPPESLALLPFGPHWPVDTGDFFVPVSALFLLSSLGAAVAGWRTRSSYRALLLIPPATVLAALVFTVLWFWPANRALWHVNIKAPDAMTDRDLIAALAHRWKVYDWLRVALGFIGLVCSTRVLSIPFPARDPAEAPASLAMKLAWAAGVGAVLAFVGYFLAKGL